MKALRERYPDATLIVTLRDPAVCAMSTASLVAFLHGFSSTDPRPEECGAMASEFIRQCVDGLVADAATHTGAQAMIHVRYDALVGDPMAAIRTLYADIGRELTSEAEQAMLEHVAHRPQHQHGVHRYAAADFGLDTNELAERYRPYRESFDVPLEVEH
jgi:hypothetical protein